MEDQQQLELVKEEAAAVSSSLTAKAEALTITTDQDAEGASGLLKEIADAKKGLETKRTGLVKPANDFVKSINTLFKSLASPIEQADSAIRSKLLKYRQDQAEIARKEQERLNKLAAQQQVRLDKKAEAKGVEAPTIVAPVVAPPPKTVAGVTARKVTKCRVVDAAKVPDRFKRIDEVALNAAVRAGERDIPGVEVYEEEVLAVR